MKPKNIKAFRKLVERYETITLEEIEKKNKSGLSVHLLANKLTGYGACGTCKLCKASKSMFIQVNCDECVYGYEFGCIYHKNSKTYNAIENAKTTKQLLKAFRNRAKHLRKTYPQYL